MKSVSIVLLALPLLLGPALLSCSDDLITGGPTSGHITTYVHWGDQAVPGKRVDLVGTGLTGVTDSSGTVGFEPGPGKFVVRVYDINRGGPAYQSVDFDVVVRGGDTTLVDVVDCLPCL